ncbi:acylphosphatase [Gracilibacillus halotolerans]|uniref:Acylphosphatase n=1 Tax=Gracilibacillus halotolerans TaxID=74386 RepID=A0A841RG52_9BACI|nr:acylphosphatase [Gracilibacillus halotolerans]MBB6511591.1 acylphosphatase [Gracilibacillus halotolerans]
MKRVYMNISGRVQGVGFRYFTQHLAIQYNIVGWVKNEEDGTVTVDAQGHEEELNNFIEQIKKGPSRFAKVNNVDLTYLDIEEKTTFKIK